MQNPDFQTRPWNLWCPVHFHRLGTPHTGNEKPILHNLRTTTSYITFVMCTYEMFSGLVPFTHPSQTRLARRSLPVFIISTIVVVVDKHLPRLTCHLCFPLPLWRPGSKFIICISSNVRCPYYWCLHFRTHIWSWNTQPRDCCGFQLHVSNGGKIATLYGVKWT